MHAYHLAELAGWLALQAPSMDEHGELPALLADQYWTNSKCRAQRWQSALRMFDSDIEAANQRLNDDQAPVHDPWPALSIVAEEIIFSELLTRIWSAVISQHELKRNQNSEGDNNDLSAIAHGVLIGQIEARNRVCRMILNAPRWADDISDRLNKIRNMAERWTDLLLSQLDSIEAARPFAFDEKRLLDFYCDRTGVSVEVQQRANQLLLNSLSQDLKSVASEFPANPDANRKIVYGVLACFANDSQAMCVLPSNIWNLKLDANHANQQQLVDQFDHGYTTPKPHNVLQPSGDATVTNNLSASSAAPNQSNPATDPAPVEAGYRRGFSAN